MREKINQLMSLNSEALNDALELCKTMEDHSDLCDLGIYIHSAHIHQQNLLCIKMKVDDVDKGLTIEYKRRKIDLSTANIQGELSQLSRDIERNCRNVKSMKKNPTGKMNKCWEISYDSGMIGKVFPAWEAMCSDIHSAFIGYDDHWKVKVLVKFTHERCEKNVEGWLDAPKATSIKALQEDDFIDLVKKWENVKVVVAEKQAFQRMTEAW